MTKHFNFTADRYPANGRRFWVSLDAEYCFFTKQSPGTGTKLE